MRLNFEEQLSMIYTQFENEIKLNEFTRSNIMHTP